LITQESDIGKIREKARKEGMVTLRENAIKKLLDGTTTYEEVLRVTWEQI
jgi:general secretion pathway protein E